MKINFLKSLFIILFLLHTSVFSSGSANKYLDSAYIYLGKFDNKCLNFAVKAKELAVIQKDKNDEAEANLVLGLASKLISLYPESVEYLIEANRLFNITANRQKIGESHLQLGETYRASTNYELAKKNINESMVIFHELNNNWHLAKSYNFLAAVYFEEMHLLYSKDWSIRKNKSGLTYIKKIDNYIDQDFVNELWLMVDKSNEYAEKSNNNETIVANLNIIAALNIFLGEYNKVEPLCKKGLDISIKHDFKNYTPLFYLSLAYLNQLLNNNAAAIEYASKAMKISEEANIKTYFMMASNSLLRTYRAEKNFEKALLHSENISNAYSERLQVALDAKIFLFKSKLERDKEEQILKSKQREIVLLWIIILTVLVSAIVIGIILYKRNRNQKRINEELNVKNKLISVQYDQLMELNTSKDKFFSIIAHDLKSPFYGLLGFSEMLVDEFDTLDDAEKKSFILRIKENVKGIYKLILNLLEWARLQNKKYELTPVSIDIYLLTHSLYQIYSPNAFKKNISLINRIEENTFAYADENMLQTVMMNLISNAIKFTESGGSVEIGAAEFDNSVSISVKDTGRGLSRQKLDMLFHLGSNIVENGTAGERGTGLGLILCKDMLEKNNGSISAQSEENKGSIFTITLPKGGSELEVDEHISNRLNSKRLKYTTA